MSFPEDDVYITGVSGAFPESKSVYDLQKSLFNKVDLITSDDRRWKQQSDAPQRTGKILDIEKFDASFFDVQFKRAHAMDPVARILHEKVYEAIVDAGYNPSELRQFKVGIYFGYNLSESEQSSVYLKQNLHEYGLTSCSRALLTNNIFQWLGVSGPSYSVDTACSSAAYAIEHAFKAIKEGRCDMALVGGANTCLIPHVSVNFNRLGVLSQDGRCKCFDNKANGYCRAETVGVVFLQKAKYSRRVYASVVHAKANCDGFKEQGITFPASSVQKQLFQSFYQECGITPSNIEYIEAHGTGTKVGDPEELRAIDEVFCKDRNGPLMIGSVKSNLGHTEAGAGICSLTKLIIAYHSGYIPPNINFTEYRKGVVGFEEARMKVVTEKQVWSRGLSAFNSFGFGGSNVHVLLKDVAQEKVNKGLPSDDLPRLVCVSGRTRSAVTRILDHLESKSVDVDEVRLWHAIHENDIPKHPYRGFVLLGSTPIKSIQMARSIKHYKSAEHSVWFLYSGFDSQWPRVTRNLMKIPAFANIVQKSHEILKCNQINVIKLLTEPNYDDSEFILNCVVSTVIVQIGLTEILKAVAIKPDQVTGQSIGKLSSDYAKGALTLEEAVSAAYFIGKALGQNGTLTDATCPGLLKELNGLMSSKQAFSILTDLQDQITLQKTIEYIPLNTIVIQLSLSVQLLGSPNNFTSVSINQEEEDSLTVMLKSLGRLYEMGLNPKLSNIYPDVQFPVAQGTSMLSHLIEWNHNDDWFVYKLSALDTVDAQEKKFYVDLKNDDQIYLASHVIDGRNMYPGTGYLVMVWKTLAMISNQDHMDVPVVFENVCFNRATTIPKTGSLEFTVSVHKKSGNFEVFEGDSAVVTGKVFAKENIGNEYKVIPDTLDKHFEPKLNLTAKDFYKELSLRGYQHKGIFRGVSECNILGTRGRVMWSDNWVVFLDLVLQPRIINYDTRGLHLPTRIERLSIDVKIHNEILDKYPGFVKSLEYKMNPTTGVARAGGVEVRSLHFAPISIKPSFGIPIYEKYIFIPNFEASKISLCDALRCDIQIVFENVSSFMFKCVELIDEEYKKNEIQQAMTSVEDILADMPLLKPELHILTEEKLKLDSNIKISSKESFNESKITLFIAANLLNRHDVLLEFMKTLRDGCFILSREKTMPHPSKSNFYDIVTIYETEFEYVTMLRKKPEPKVTKFVRIVTEDKSFSWIEKVKENIEKVQKLVLYNQGEGANGLLGLVNCLRREPGGESISGLLIADQQAPKFDPDLEFYSNQLDKDLVFNVYQDGKWGTYRHVLMEDTKPVSSSHAFVDIKTVGNLSSLQWLQGPLNFKTTSKALNLMHVYCAGLNFRDVMIALGRVSRNAVANGRLAQDCLLGIEASGKIANGTRVTAICGKGISNIVCIQNSLVIPIPDEWTFKEAATIPVAYSTVYIALILVGKARRGESILIHAGSGGVGQAAINVSLHLGLEVFTTVGTTTKKNFIKKLFPQLKESHIGNSRDTTFEDMILEETKGEGVDIVLNSLADEKLQASVRCLTNRRGRFLEIGKVDILNNSVIEMYLFKKEIAFHGIMLDYINEPQSSKLRQSLRKLIISGIVSGAVRPLTNCTFRKNQIETAFRYMAAGKHIGKVVIKIRDEERRNETSPRPVSVNVDAIPRFTCEEKGVYVLVGGLGGFGLELADWLVLRGARKLLLCSRRGVSTGYQAMRIRIWNSYGVDVKISTWDVTEERGCIEMLKIAKSMGTVKAVFNLAVVLNDAVFQNQTRESFQQSYGPKAKTSMNLDNLTRTMCPQLKNFVLFSSAACGRGNSGQTNYGFSNSVMERICELRKRDGLPALAIQWGAIGDVGFVADQQQDNIQVEIGGTLQQRILSCLEAVDKFLTQEEAAIVSSIVVAEKKFEGGFQNSSMYAVANIMGIKDLKTISHQASLAELGMDSIMAVEIKQTLEREFEIYLTNQEIRNLCFAKLLEYDANRDKENEKVLMPIDDKSHINQNTIDLLLKNLGDEKFVSQCFVRLPTLRDDPLQKEAFESKSTLFLMSGIVNCASTLTTLCSKLKCKACVLQLGLENLDEDLDQMVERLYPILKTQISPGNTFALLGYSFGTLVQLKLAAKLENDGHRGIIICVDGGPEYLNYLAKSVVTGENYNNLEYVQRAILKRFFNICAPKENQNIAIQDVFKHISFEDRIHALVNMAPENLKYSKNFLANMIAAFYHRLLLVINNENELKKLDKKLKSKIILIRTRSLPPFLECSENYGLGIYSEGEVTIHRINEDHKTIIECDECANIVNNIVSQEEKRTYD